MDISNENLLQNREMRMLQFLKYFTLKTIRERNQEFKLKFKKEINVVLQQGGVVHKDKDLIMKEVSVTNKQSSKFKTYINKGDVKKNANMHDAGIQTEINANHINVLSKDTFINAFKLDIFKSENTNKNLTDIFTELIKNLNLLLTKKKNLNQSNESDQNDEDLSINSNGDLPDSKETLTRKIGEQVDNGIKLINSVALDQLKLNEMLKALINENDNLHSENESLKENVDKVKLINDNMKDIYNEIFEFLLNTYNDNLNKMDKYFQSVSNIESKVLIFVQNYIKTGKENNKKGKHTQILNLIHLHSFRKKPSRKTIL